MTTTSKLGGYNSQSRVKPAKERIKEQDMSEVRKTEKRADRGLRKSDARKLTQPVLREAELEKIALEKRRKELHPRAIPVSESAQDRRTWREYNTGVAHKAHESAATYDEWLHDEYWDKNPKLDYDASVLPADLQDLYAIHMQTEAMGELAETIGEVEISAWEEPVDYAPIEAAMTNRDGSTLFHTLERGEEAFKSWKNDAHEPRYGIMARESLDTVWRTLFKMGACPSLPLIWDNNQAL